MRWGRGGGGPAAPDGSWYTTGDPLPGSEVTVAAVDNAAAGGAAALRAVDPAFDPDAFVGWTLTVYDRAIAAWRTRNPEPLRPVMDGAVWDSYARHLLMVSTLPLAQSLMAAAKGVPTLVGATDGGGYQSALISLDVMTDPAVVAQWKLPGGQHTWQERWLFQRPSSCRTYPSGAVAVCPVCGAPAQAEETGRCRYCHADITTRTAGWLVTRTQTTQAAMAKMDDRLARVRSEVAGRIPLPPAPVVGAPLQPPRAGPAG